MMYKQNLTLKNFQRINEVTSLTSFTLLRQISSNSSCCCLDHMNLKNCSVLGLMAFSSAVPGCNQLNTLVPPSPTVATKKHKEHFRPHLSIVWLVYCRLLWKDSGAPWQTKGSFVLPLCVSVSTYCNCRCQHSSMHLLH